MDPAARVIHAGTSPTSAELWLPRSAPERAGDGSYLAVCGGTYSWTISWRRLNALGHDRGS